MFFVSVGMMIDPKLIAEHWQALIVLTAAVVGGKIVGVTFASMLSGVGTKTSIEAGMSLSQIGEFSFIIAGAGLKTGATRDFLYTLAVAVSAVTTFLTPYMIRGSIPLAEFVSRADAAAAQGARGALRLVARADPQRGRASARSQFDRMADGDDRCRAQS